MVNHYFTTIIIIIIITMYHVWKNVIYILNLDHASPRSLAETLRLSSHVRLCLEKYHPGVLGWWACLVDQYEVISCVDTFSQSSSSRWISVAQWVSSSNWHGPHEFTETHGIGTCRSTSTSTNTFSACQKVHQLLMLLQLTTCMKKLQWLRSSSESAWLMKRWRWWCPACRMAYLAAVAVTWQASSSEHSSYEPIGISVPGFTCQHIVSSICFGSIPGPNCNHSDLASSPASNLIPLITVRRSKQNSVKWMN